MEQAPHTPNPQAAHRRHQTRDTFTWAHASDHRAPLHQVCRHRDTQSSGTLPNTEGEAQAVARKRHKRQHPAPSCKGPEEPRHNPHDPNRGVGRGHKQPLPPNTQPKLSTLLAVWLLTHTGEEGETAEGGGYGTSLGSLKKTFLNEDGSPHQPHHALLTRPTGEHPAQGSSLKMG